LVRYPWKQSGNSAGCGDYRKFVQCGGFGLLLSRLPLLPAPFSQEFDSAACLGCLDQHSSRRVQSLVNTMQFQYQSLSLAHQVQRSGRVLAQALRIHIANQAASNGLLSLSNLPLLVTNPLFNAATLLLNHGHGALMPLLDGQSSLEQWIE